VRALLRDGGAPSPAERTEALRQVSRLVSSYEGIVRRYPTSGLCRQRAVQGASLAEAAYRPLRTRGRSQHGRAPLRVAGPRVPGEPAGPARADAGGGPRESRGRRGHAAAGARCRRQCPRRRRPCRPQTLWCARRDRRSPLPCPPARPRRSSAPARATVTDIQRVVLQDSVRVTLELDHEAPYYEERITGPDRVFFDLRGAQLSAHLTDKVITLLRRHRAPDSARAGIRTGRCGWYSIWTAWPATAWFTLYNPYRVVIDCERAAAVAVKQATVTPPTRVAADTSSEAPPPPAAPGAGAAASLAPAASAEKREVAATPTTTRSDSASRGRGADTSRQRPRWPLSNGRGAVLAFPAAGLGISRHRHRSRARRPRPRGPTGTGSRSRPDARPSAPAGRSC